MKIIHAEMSAQYSGRGETMLRRYPRVLILKEDKSIAIHGDKGFKPMNYMTPPLEITEVMADTGEVIMTFDSKNESLTIVLHKIFSEMHFDLGGDEPGLEKDHTEKHLQDWAEANIKELDPTLTFIEREYQTGNGPVDILAERDSGELVALEIKKVAPMGTVSQVLRYTDGMEEVNPGRLIEGAIAAIEVKKKTTELAKKKNVKIYDIPLDWSKQDSTIVEEETNGAD